MNIPGTLTFSADRHLYSVSIPSLGFWISGFNFEEGNYLVNEELTTLYPKVKLTIHWPENPNEEFSISSTDKRLAATVQKLAA